MGFEFAQGQCVNHEHGSMASIVIDRSRTSKGKEHYYLKTIAIGERRERWMLGEFLVPSVFGGGGCAGCRRAVVCPLG